MPPRTELQLQVAGYENKAAHNDAVWKDFAQRTDSVDFLKAHRDWVEQNAWGFGDRAFHYMWYLMLKDDVLTRRSPSLLEIGVYKGQVISLWALIAQHVCRPVDITAISPLEGSRPWLALSLKKLLGRLKRVMIGWATYVHLGLASNLFQHAAKGMSSFVDRNLIADLENRSANFYARGTYREDINRIFEEFGLQNADVKVIKGYSQDERVRRQVAGKSFDVIYIDGGHRFEEVTADLEFYAPLVSPGGYLVMDDASCRVPGTAFPKGHESVSRAVEDWGAPGFLNVLNIGHNRVYMRSP